MSKEFNKENNIKFNKENNTKINKEFYKDFIKDYNKEVVKDFNKENNTKINKEFYKDFIKDYNKEVVKDFNKENNRKLNKEVDNKVKLIHYAAYNGYYEMLLKELNNGINVDCVTNECISFNIYNNNIIYFSNVTPLYLSAQRGHTKCVKLLMERGANPKNIVCKPHTNYKITPLDVAIIYCNLCCYILMKKKYNTEKYLNHIV